jgi:hypothetical protein
VVPPVRTFTGEDKRKEARGKEAARKLGENQDTTDRKGRYTEFLTYQPGAGASRLNG